jgi:predicted ATP-dependent endonuclease of OLD family
MRIKPVHIEGYRCIADLRVDFDDLTAFTGT